MGFVNQIVPMLKAEDAFVLHITRAKDTTINVRIEPRITLPDAETSDPELASLQVALAMPLLLRIDTATVADVDTEIAKAIAGMSHSRQTTQGALDAYQEAQSEARNAAALAAKAKAEQEKTVKAPAGKKTGTPLQAAAAEPSTDAPSSTATTAETASTATAASTAESAPADAAQRCIFE